MTNCYECESSRNRGYHIVDLMSCGHAVCSLCGKNVENIEKKLGQKMISKCSNCYNN